MLRRVLITKERDLDEGDGQGVCVFVKGYFERRPDAVIETSADALSFDSGFGEGFDDFLGNFWGAFVGELFLVVIGWEAEETERISELKPKLRRIMTHS